MKKIKQVLKKFSDKLIKKSYWLPESLAQKIKREAELPQWKSESALMRHIINNWFKK